MNHYNKLKLRVLSLFAFADDAWLGPREAAERLNFLPPALGMVILQKVVEVWITGEAFPRPRNFGIQDQRARYGTASVATFAARLMRESWIGHYCGIVPTMQSNRTFLPWLLQFRVFRFGSDEDGNIWVGVFPERKKILICSAALYSGAL
jgi:hypothetical protein